ncbi:MAG: hypothetical protein OEU25_17740 [Rhodospirillales bacterium]|nr:hypothetical protein [Rhodospirillales bacterium]
MPSFKTASGEADASQRSAKHATTAHLDPALAGPAFSKDRAKAQANILARIDEASDFEVASEAIVVLDIVQSTYSTNLFGWHSVGRVVTRDLRRLTREASAPRGLTSVKTTGDGLLLTFSNRDSAEMAVPSALAAMWTLLARARERNAQAPAQQRLDLRVAVHFGEVDIIENDREGPNVAFAFRLEKVSRGSLPSALNPIDPRAFKTANYVIGSEAVADVLDRVGEVSPRKSCGLFKLRGFPGWSEVFLLEPASKVRAVPRSSLGA